MKFEVRYKDKKGDEISYFESDGSTLKTQLRGILFYGKSFDNLKPLESDLEKAKKLFTLTKYNELTACELAINIPIKIRNKENLIGVVLTVEMVLDDADYPTVKKFSINIDGKDFNTVQNEKTPLFFESQLILLQRLIPGDYKIQACLFCGLSHYFVCGSESFGSLFCFREIKNQILKVANKNDFVDLSLNNGFNVQETFYCPDFVEISSQQWIYKNMV